MVKMDKERQAGCHNPSVKMGDLVVARLIADEDAGYLEPHDDYKVISVCPEVILSRLPGGQAVTLDVELFTRTGEIGEERFTVVGAPEPEQFVLDFDEFLNSPWVKSKESSEKK